MKWYSAKHFLPGDEYKYTPGYEGQELYIIYHHGDNALMTNLAIWDGKNFKIGTTCYCDECDCDCSYHSAYSSECIVTHWMPLELPDFDMDVYENV